MDRVEEAIFHLGKRHDDFVSAAAISNSAKMKAKRSMKTEAIHELNRVRVVRAAAGGKDRHSKVCTARGTRDRRVRLSPKTAILFYDVQDRLGYDRPSKAIDWLMKEAKSAIDALDEAPTAAAFSQPNNGPPNSKNQQMLKFECAMIQDHSSDYNPISGEVAAPPPSSAEFPSPLELFDANSEIVRLQRFFSRNYGGEDYSSAPLRYEAEAGADYRMFSEREPLQSSYSPQFQGGFSYSEQELPNFCAAATTFKEDEMDYVPVLSNSSSFLHYEE